MTEDEKLVEKVAEAMWNVHSDRLWYKHWMDKAEDAREAYRDYARAAISAVRENDKEQGLVHADSTGAERSADLSAYVVSKCGTYWVPRTTADRCICGNDLDAYCDYCKSLLAATPNGKIDDRSAPAASREPDLPSSLTVRHRHMEGGIKG